MALVTVKRRQVTRLVGLGAGAPLTLPGRGVQDFGIKVPVPLAPAPTEHTYVAAPIAVKANTTTKLQAAMRRAAATAHVATATPVPTPEPIVDDVAPKVDDSTPGIAPTETPPPAGEVVISLEPALSEVTSNRVMLAIGGLLLGVGIIGFFKR